MNRCFSRLSADCAVDADRHAEPYRYIRKRTFNGMNPFDIIQPVSSARLLPEAQVRLRLLVAQ